MRTLDELLIEHGPALQRRSEVLEDLAQLLYGLFLRRLSASVEAVWRDTRRSAVVGCAEADVLAGGRLTPTLLYESQEGLRKQLLGVQHELRDLKDRAPSWARLVKGTRRPHLPLLGDLRRGLERQEVALRVIADALAWLVLGEDPRVLVPLYKDSGGGLPPRVSITGPLLITRKALESGTFFIVENDLTRCLGVGDLTVVFADRPWKRPLSLEVKTSGPFVEGEHLAIQGVAATSDDPVDVSLAHEFYEAAGMKDLPADIPARDEPAQTAELVSRAELLYAATERPGRPLHALSSRAWRTIGVVVSRALAEGVCWDLVERGVVVFAARAVDGRLPADAKATIREALGDLGFDLDRAVTTEDFLRRDAWSTLVRPIPLWSVERRARAALMAGDLVFGCIVLRETWFEAMRAEGLEVEASEDGTWLVAGRFGTASLDAIEVGKLVLGAYLSGVSPREVAARLAALPVEEGNHEARTDAIEH